MIAASLVVARVFAVPLLLIFALAGVKNAAAQTYPAKSVKGIVGFPAGGGSDALARLMSAALSDKFGQQFVVDNKAG
ncbi:MAG: tripartite tricarboxylate transporter substrate binding protein, partial [Burkholderiales bacterium]